MRTVIPTPHPGPLPVEGRGRELRLGVHPSGCPSYASKIEDSFSLSSMNRNALAEEVNLLDVVLKILVGACIGRNLNLYLRQGLEFLVSARFEDAQFQIEVGRYDGVCETVCEVI